MIGARNAAAHVDGREQGSIGQNHRDAGQGVEVLRIADKQPGDVGQAIARPRVESGLVVVPLGSCCLLADISQPEGNANHSPKKAALAAVA